MSKPVREQELKVAVIVTEYRHNSHADVILGRLLGEFDYTPQLKVASLYTDQVPSNDMSREKAEKYGIPIFPTIAEAIAIGQEKDRIDGVVIIGEHGDYPENEKRQKMYPRRRLLEEVLQALDRLNLCIPVFSDKHLAYDMSDALWMYEQLKQRGIPFMGGSSVPLADTVPPFQVETARSAREILVVSFSSSIEAYGFHGMEVLQRIAEQRIGGEQGVASIQAMEGAAVWEAMDRGEWPEDLLFEALSTMPDLVPGHPRDQVADPVLLSIEYRDGTKGYVIQLQNYVNQWLSAFRCQDGQISSSRWITQTSRPFNHFERLTQYVERLIVSRQSPVPIERTLMTTGLIDLGMESLYKQARINTPELHISYQPL
ncbi:hypothetical protein [Paenibacillus sp. J2TS4]|uniref:hypothetical protein n=1 Tax=Paenibacillus sp. J2TS4 TaxID=2807194 RepID=UPI001B0A81C7|nr:hypothetical protein [Paenibacillus sp. J2TS4]GIP34637.1 hypothetical protein J2TS4_38470 [Paenibacillus sp. J2TS4]